MHVICVYVNQSPITDPTDYSHAVRKVHYYPLRPITRPILDPVCQYTLDLLYFNLLDQTIMQNLAKSLAKVQVHHIYIIASNNFFLLPPQKT